MHQWRLPESRRHPWTEPVNRLSKSIKIRPLAAEEERQQVISGEHMSQIEEHYQQADRHQAASDAAQVAYDAAYDERKQ